MRVRSTRSHRSRGAYSPGGQGFWRGLGLQPSGPDENCRSSIFERGHGVVNLFFEASTRTRTSAFEIAAKRWGRGVFFRYRQGFQRF